MTGCAVKNIDLAMRTKHKAYIFTQAQQVNKPPFENSGLNT